MRVVKRRAKERAAMKAACELARQLFHAADCRQLWHVFAQHFEVFK